MGSDWCGSTHPSHQVETIVHEGRPTIPMNKKVQISTNYGKSWGKSAWPTNLYMKLWIRLYKKKYTYLICTYQLVNKYFKKHGLIIFFTSQPRQFRHFPILQELRVVICDCIGHRAYHVAGISPHGQARVLGKSLKWCYPLMCGETNKNHQVRLGSDQQYNHIYKLSSNYQVFSGWVRKQQ